MTVDPRPPQLLLADRDWRLRNSVWMLAAILGCGMSTWAAFLYIGIKARRRAWLVAAAVYAVAFIAMMIVAGLTENDPARTSDNPASDLMGGVLVATWIAGVVHAFMVRPAWLRWRAEHNQPWWSAAAPPPPAYPSYPSFPPPGYPSFPPAAVPPQVAPMVDQNRFWAPPPTPQAPPPIPQAPPIPPAPPADPTGPVRVAVATPDELASLGIDPVGVHRLLAARDRPGGIATLQEFAELAGLAPHQLSAVAGRVLLDPPPADPGPSFPVPPHQGRRLDL